MLIPALPARVFSEKRLYIEICAWIHTYRWAVNALHFQYRRFELDSLSIFKPMLEINFRVDLGKVNFQLILFRMRFDLPMYIFIGKLCHGVKARPVIFLRYYQMYTYVLIWVGTVYKCNIFPFSLIRSRAIPEDISLYLKEALFLFPRILPPVVVCILYVYLYVVRSMASRESI